MKRLRKIIFIAFGVVSLSIAVLGIVIAIRQGVDRPTGFRDLRYVSHNGQGSVVISLALFTLVVGSFLGIGLILIIGTLMRWEFLMHPPDSGLFYYLYDPLRRHCGEKGIVYLHLFVGILFVLASIWLVIYVAFLA